jgi:hypothetical protein
MKIRFDGKDYDLSTPADAAAFQQAVSDYTARHGKELATESARADAADAKVKKLETEIADTSRFDAAVSERVELETAARAILGAGYELRSDGKAKSSRAIMLDVIRADDKDFSDKDASGQNRSDDYVRARFDFTLKGATRFDSIRNAPKIVREAEKKQGDLRNDANEMPDVEGARLAMIERDRTAWETPVAKA